MPGDANAITACPSSLMATDGSGICAPVAASSCAASQAPPDHRLAWTVLSVPTLCCHTTIASLQSASTTAVGPVKKSECALKVSGADQPLEPHQLTTT